jgi:hypothetical protein
MAFKKEIEKLFFRAWARASGRECESERKRESARARERA